MTQKIIRGIALVLVALSVSVTPAWTQDDKRQSHHPESVIPPSSPPTVPGMSKPLLVNPNPTKFEAGPLGDVYVTGVLSGLGQWQENAFPGDREWQTDVTNAQVFVQNIEGPVQFYLQGGTYSIPVLGLAYLRADEATDAYFGTLPQAFLKLVPTENFSIMAGKLPTLIGAEYTFSFQNTNIQRGLLWNQENAVNRGVQANYTLGPVALSVSWNDGFYSDRWSWLSGCAIYTIDSSNAIAIVGGGNTQRTTIATSATPLFQNNEQIYNVIYTHSSGPWTLQPYLQFTSVPRTDAGAGEDAQTYGAALLANYSFDADSDLGGVKLAGVSLPMRVEYLASRGSDDEGAPNLLYGSGSEAWSVTVTPTYQYKLFFARAEFSFVKALATADGVALGETGTDTSQARALMEMGVLF